VADGVYNGGAVTTKNGTAANRITYKSINKWGAQIVRNIAVASGTMVWRNFGDYVTVDGFDVTGTCAVGLMGSGSWNNFINNHVHHIIALCDGFGGAGIGMDDYSTPKVGGLIDSNVINDIGPWATNCFRVQGAYTSISQVIISNNLIYRVVGYGITQGHASYKVIVYNNTVFNCGGTVEGGGIVFTNNTNPSSLPSDNNIVANNNIYNCVYGIHEEGVQAGIDTTRYTNNNVYNDPGLVSSGGTAYVTYGNMTNSHTGISANPQFVNYLADGGGNYHLQSTSPCRNAGIASSTEPSSGIAHAAPTLDFDGIARPQEGTFDLGAYEYVAAAPVTDWYVATTGSDSNDGQTVGTPFLTFTKADSMASPGNTIHVAPGTYSGSFITVALGTSGNPITWISTVKWGAKIVPPASSAIAYGWDNQGAWNIVDGFEIDGSVNPSGTIWNHGIRVTGGNSIVQNCKVHNIFNTGPADANGGNGIYLDDSVSGGNNWTVQRNLIRDIGPAAAGATYYVGIKSTNISIIQNNIIGKCLDIGVLEVRNCNNSKVTNNTIFNCNIGLLAAGTTTANNFILCTNNILYGNTTGMSETGTMGANNLYSNNCLNNNGANTAGNFGTTATNTAPVTGNPLFTSYLANGLGDYHLETGSSCIGTGLATYIPVYDYSELLRSPQVDIGAYKYLVAATSYIFVGQFLD